MSSFRDSRSKVTQHHSPRRNSEDCSPPWLILILAIRRVISSIHSSTLDVRLLIQIKIKTTKIINLTTMIVIFSHIF